MPSWWAAHTTRFTFRISLLGCSRYAPGSTPMAALINSMPQSLLSHLSVSSFQYAPPHCDQNNDIPRSRTDWLCSPTIWFPTTLKWPCLATGLLGGGWGNVVVLVTVLEVVDVVPVELEVRVVVIVVAVLLVAVLLVRVAVLLVAVLLVRVTVSRKLQYPS